MHLKRRLKLLKYFPYIAWLSVWRFYNGNYTYQASALAFITLLCVVPFVSVIVYVASFFVFFHDFVYMANNYIYANFVPRSSDAMQQYLDQFVIQAGQLPTLSITFSVISGVMLILTVEHSLNNVWHVRHKSKDVLTTFISWSILTLMPIYFGISVLVTGYISSLAWFNHYQVFVLDLLNWLVNATVFTVLYIVVPNKLVDWSDGFLGGLIAAALFELAKKIFAFYITYFANYQLIYGALAIVPILLVWIYVTWSIILYGALFIKAKNDLLKVKAAQNIHFR